MWEAEIDGNDATGVEPQLTMKVARGQAIRFIVHRRGTIGFDTTHWDPVLTYDDGQTFQASRGFSTSGQGEAGWYYEMEADGNDNPSADCPLVHGFRREFLLFDQPIPPNGSLEFRPDDALPVWVVADNIDRSGIAVALLKQDSWKLSCLYSDADRLDVQLATTIADKSATLGPGQSIRLPGIVLLSYHGPWLTGICQLDKALTADPESGGRSLLRDALGDLARRAEIISDGEPCPELDLLAMVQLDWIKQDGLQDTADSYSASTTLQIQRAEDLLDGSSPSRADDQLATAARALKQLATESASDNASLRARRLLYVQTRSLKRRIALANPLMDFGSLVFCKRVPTSYSHLVMQYYGWRARPGGGLFVLDRPGHSLSCRDILNGRLAKGNVLEPRLSYDGKRVVFSYVECQEGGRSWDPTTIDNERDEGFYHVWTVNVDGTDLRQLTAGPFDDLMPCWLPDGGVAFSSTRRRGYARCFGGQFSRRWHVYTLHRMQADGTDLRILSAHDTNEWFPTVSNTGNIFYSRWDYIDRDAVTHQNLWAMRPDGTNPIAVWGNATDSPHCVFQPQPIPGGGKVVFTASAHHSITAGSIAVVDPAIGDNGQQAITRLTPEIPFPEAESRDIQEYYAAPWPLSDKFFLVAYSPTPLAWEPAANAPNALGIYLLDNLGNRELIYRDPEIGSTNPCPLSPRPVPPIVPSLLLDRRSQPAKWSSPTFTRDWRTSLAAPSRRCVSFKSCRKPHPSRIRHQSD